VTNFARPVAQRPQNWLANLRALAAANASGGTQYQIEYPKRKAGDTRPESQRGESMSIIGSDLSHDHAGNPTGLTGAGVAVYNTTAKEWKRVQE
jgi:hypothetical protein